MSSLETDHYCLSGMLNQKFQVYQDLILNIEEIQEMKEDLTYLVQIEAMMEVEGIIVPAVGMVETKDMKIVDMGVEAEVTMAEEIMIIVLEILDLLEDTKTTEEMITAEEGIMNLNLVDMEDMIGVAMIEVGNTEGATTEVGKRGADMDRTEEEMKEQVTTEVETKEADMEEVINHMEEEKEGITSQETIQGTMRLQLKILYTSQLLRTMFGEGRQGVTKVTQLSGALQ
jgi:hypothetical protein